MSSKKQVDLVCEKGGSVFEQPAVRLANLLEVSNEPKDRKRQRVLLDASCPLSRDVGT